MVVLKKALRCYLLSIVVPQEVGDFTATNINRQAFNFTVPSATNSAWTEEVSTRGLAVAVQTFTDERKKAIFVVEAKEVLGKPRR